LFAVVVALGTALAAVMLPALALRYGWHAAAWTQGVVGIVGGVLFGIFHRDDVGQATSGAMGTPPGFRALLNSFLPRKRVIAQALVRDESGRVLMCHPTYKDDWDLPGGVVEVRESPREAAAREVLEELGLRLPLGRLVLTDWMPPWGGWDDALCLVFDAGVHPASVLDGVVLQRREIRATAFISTGEVHARAADYTARRVDAALASLEGTGAAFTESGRTL